MLLFFRSEHTAGKLAHSTQLIRLPCKVETGKQTYLAGRTGDHLGALPRRYHMDQQLQKTYWQLYQQPRSSLRHQMQLRAWQADDLYLDL